MAKLQGYSYRITPEKVRMKGKKKRKRRKHTAPAASATPAPAPKPAARGGISVSDIEAVKGLVDRIGADGVQELAGVLAE